MGVVNELYTKELQEKVCADYINGEQLSNIYERYGITAKQVDYIIRKNDVPRRKPKTKKIAKQCPKCHKKVEGQGFRFCPYCGSDIRTQGELLAERLTNLCNYASHMPEHIRDEFISVLNTAAKEVSNGAKHKK